MLDFITEFISNNTQMVIVAVIALVVMVGMYMFKPQMFKKPEEKPFQVPGMDMNMDMDMQTQMEMPMDNGMCNMDTGVCQSHQEMEQQQMTPEIQQQMMQEQQQMTPEMQQQMMQEQQQMTPENEMRTEM